MNSRCQKNADFVFSLAFNGVAKIKKSAFRSHSEAQFVGFGSGSGSNLKALAENEEKYRLRAIFSDRACSCKQLAQTLHIPFLTLPSDQYSEAAIIQMLEDLQKRDRFQIDAIFLAGYMRIIKEPLLRHFQNRILNIHPGDLSIRGDDQKRLFRGKDAVLKAVLCREKSTRSTVHLVNHGVDEGKILYISEPLDLNCPEHIERLLPQTIPHKTSSYLDLYIPKMPLEVIEFARRHQEKQKSVCDWPSIVSVARQIAAGQIKLPIGG